MKGLSFFSWGGFIFFRYAKKEKNTIYMKYLSTFTKNRCGQNRYIAVQTCLKYPLTIPIYFLIHRFLPVPPLPIIFKSFAQRQNVSQAFIQSLYTQHASFVIFTLYLLRLAKITLPIIFQGNSAGILTAGTVNLGLVSIDCRGCRRTNCKEKQFCFRFITIFLLISPIAQSTS